MLLSSKQVVKKSVLNEFLNHNYIGKSQKLTFYNISSTHAEMDAINKIKHKKNNPSSVDLLVIKFSKQGILKESKPCFHCLKYMKKSGVNIENIYCSSSLGEIDKYKFNDLYESSRKGGYVSYGMRKKRLC